MNGSITHWAWLGVLALVLGTTSAWAQQDGDAHRGDRDARTQERDPHDARHGGSTGLRGMDEGDLRRLVGDLGLTDEQQSQIREALGEARERRGAWFREHGQEMRELRRAVHEARQAGDREQFREKWAELGELMFDAPAPGPVIDEVRGVLNDEQWDKLQANWQAMREQMGERRRGERRADDPEGERRGPRDRGGRDRRGDGDGDE